MSSKIELLPCPHCGKDQTNFHHYSRKIGFDVFYCIRCYCCAETIGWTPEEAAACWNSRTAPPELAELQAAIAQQAAEIERLKEAHEQVCTNYNKVSYASEERGKEIERLKGGQGEAVAWINVATGHVTTSSVVVMDWDDEKEQVQSLYASQPAPVSSELVQLLERAKVYARGPFLDEINVCLDKVKELNQ